jgi:hypothetical protein
MKTYLGSVKNVPFLFGFGRSITLKQIAKDLSKKLPNSKITKHALLGRVTGVEITDKGINGNFYNETLSPLYLDGISVHTIYGEIKCSNKISKKIDNTIKHYLGSDCSVITDN